MISMLWMRSFEIRMRMTSLTTLLRNEKYESGPSVKKTESMDREFRAKQDDVPSLD